MTGSLEGDGEEPRDASGIRRGPSRSPLTLLTLLLRPRRIPEEG